MNAQEIFDKVTQGRSLTSRDFLENILDEMVLPSHFLGFSKEQKNF